MKELDSALLPKYQHDACFMCSKRTDGLHTCFYRLGDELFKICPTCIEETDFCYSCGVHGENIELHYCSNCIEEFNDTFK